QIIRTINRPKEILLIDAKEISDIPHADWDVLSCALNDNHLPVSNKVGCIPFPAPRHYDVVDQVIKVDDQQHRHNQGPVQAKVYGIPDVYSMRCEVYRCGKVSKQRKQSHPRDGLGNSPESRFLLPVQPL